MENQAGGTAIAGNGPGDLERRILDVWPHAIGLLGPANTKVAMEKCVILCATGHVSAFYGFGLFKDDSGQCQEEARVSI